MVWVDVAGLGITEAQMEELKNSLLDKGIKIGAGRGTAFRIVVHRQNNGKVGMLVDAFREYLERVRGK